ncbi:hypothetical protein [Pseudonocardia sp. WMMC193]|uniref:hypothetical protein n=1 Tax=Pseudonocardia sp. WMMC193 TaxID=2911965 RepID=UPI001F39FF39|nr:hypothetical protein [Pseudonocardia sp. WMMC193]MCF7550986.1 hypothetical protein [Pseudonocardia sp. WMMC193]
MHGPATPAAAAVDDGPATERDPVLDWLAHQAGIAPDPWQAAVVAARAEGRRVGLIGRVRRSWPLLRSAIEG